MSGTIRRLGFAALLMLAGSYGVTVRANAPDSAKESWTPTPELIAGTERWLRMPAGTRLDQYSRYYYGSVEGGRRMLIGVFIRDEKPRGVQITTREKVPRIADGGCHQVTLIFDVAAKQTVLLRCNGYA